MPPLQTPLLSQHFSSVLSSSHSTTSLQNYFYCGFLFSKYQLSFPDLPSVLSLLDRLNALFITTKQRNNILQKVAGHTVNAQQEVQDRVGELEKIIFEYVDEVVPHLQMAVELQRIRKESLKMEKEIEIEIEQDNLKDSEIGNHPNSKQQPKCTICLQPISSSNLHILECSHFFHRLCVSLSLQQKFHTGILSITCPQQSCHRQIPSQQVLNLLSKPNQQKYETFVFKKYVSDNYETMCWCPTIGCQYVFCFELGESTFVCPVCSKFYCLKCHSEYHVGMSCRQFSRTKVQPEDDQKFYQFAEGARYKQCPKCKFWVQKSQGCHHMVCRCQFEFCYACGEEYPNCGCNTEEQAQRAELALQVAAEQLRVIAEGLQEHQRELVRLGLERAESEREFRSTFVEVVSGVLVSEEQRQEQEKKQEQAVESNDKQLQVIKQPETLTSYRQLQSKRAKPNIQSTSVSSNQRGSTTKNEFQKITQQSFVLPLNKPFHRSPEPRKIFKTRNLFPSNPKDRHYAGEGKSVKTERLEYEKSLTKVEKQVKVRPLEPMPYQFSTNRKFTFTDLSERKISQTKY